MAYFEGDGLERRIKRQGYWPLYELLQQVSAGTANWPEPATISPAPGRVEQTRILLYSMLNETRLKPDFEVCRVGDQLVIDQKAGGPASNAKVEFGYDPRGPRRSRSGPIHRGHALPADPGDVMGDEGYVDFFKSLDSERTATDIPTPPATTPELPHFKEGDVSDNHPDPTTSQVVVEYLKSWPDSVATPKETPAYLKYYNILAPGLAGDLEDWQQPCIIAVKKMVRDMMARGIKISKAAKGLLD